MNTFFNDEITREISVMEFIKQVDPIITLARGVRH